MENVARQKVQKTKDNQELYKNRKKEYNELNLIIQFNSIFLTNSHKKTFYQKMSLEMMIIILKTLKE